MNGKAKDGEDSYELEANITALTEQQVIEKTGVVPTSITPCPDLTPNELITMMRTGAPTNNIQTTGCCTLYCYGSPIQQCCGVVFLL